jgi:hypothetical protein
MTFDTATPSIRVAVMQRPCDECTLAGIPGFRP